MHDQGTATWPFFHLFLGDLCTYSLRIWPRAELVVDGDVAAVSLGGIPTTGNRGPLPREMFVISEGEDRDALVLFCFVLFQALHFQNFKNVIVLERGHSNAGQKNRIYKPIRVQLAYVIPWVAGKGW